ncbi:hypothetical protein G6F50_015963 [Rhizopus delemar]|uniref:Uncharacterized protein n=1 Tax=Rhizopus delemar TaxID=936053 RepID=A0A9P7C390_9FUNG|nr:hypothetical protein G6F50_015963 [Rhizopus delemar]
MNLDRFRVFGPDETASNRLSAIYDASGKTWMAQMLDSDADGGNLSPTGRVMEILSAQTLEGWLEGDVLTGKAPGGLAYARAVAEPADHLARLAAGPQWVQPSGSRISGHRGQQKS